MILSVKRVIGRLAICGLVLAFGESAGVADADVKAQ